MINADVLPKNLNYYFSLKLWFNHHFPMYFQGSFIVNDNFLSFFRCIYRKQCFFRLFRTIAIVGVKPRSSPDIYFVIPNLGMVPWSKAAKQFWLGTFLCLVAHLPFFSQAFTKSLKGGILNLDCLVIQGCLCHQRRYNS